jgi:hypothetical protein
VRYLFDSDAQYTDPVWLSRVIHPGYEPSVGAGVSVTIDGCIDQSEVFAASTPTPTVDRKAGATKGKGRERGWGGRAVLCSLGLDWVWTGLILFIVILLRCVAVSILEEFLHVFTYARTDIIHVPSVSGV